MEQDAATVEEVDVNIDIEIENPANEAVEIEITFEEPLNFEEYDEFSLTRVVQRKLQEKSEQPVRETVVSKEKAFDIGSIDKYLKYDEDEKELARVEQIQKSMLQQKLLDSVADLSMEDDNVCEESESIKTITSVAVESAKSAAAPHKPGNTWVQTHKLPASAYEKLRPNLALEYPFELDEFQKQAVMRLENREHVFVAAHTSAGKTVVAEYAIALALKNNTRTVYTSPIKALSNQKYRDFKEKFGADNVGIVTGDVSVNPQAKCLIMTTEIFRSMLYKGSDTIRDVEFVIFDEVHYVNDSERGVVWEEVIIMLQPHVCLIFLSATTPNAADFSEWIGRTKQKRVYLISTNKRPVPLQHFLYYDDEIYPLMEANKPYNANMIAHVKHITAEKNKPKPPSAENQQMANQRKQEKAAIAAQAAGGNKAKQQQITNKVMAGRGGGGRGSASSRGSSAGAGQQKGSNSGTRPQWNTLIKLLQQGGREAAGGLKEVNFGVATSRSVLSAGARKEKEDKYVPYERLPAEMRATISKRDYEKEEFRGAEDEPEHASDFRRDMGLLPVVIFSFSKKKCEEIADYLKGQDLLTRKEKGKVYVLFESILTRLQPIDHDLPQILRMREMLLRGFGVHHSGLLPILKETVEILFSQSIVKVLLATETFAMGVNMPARSVVFNGYRKHDGKEFRDLLPGEYIQMAGRAGRRGLDQVGTVIVAAWLDVPEELGMKNLLTGKPTILSSQFRLRYNMILNLIRVNNMTIQDMIKSSFTEFASQKLLSNHNLIHKLTRYENYLEFLKADHYQTCWEYLTTASPHAAAYLEYINSTNEDTKTTTGSDKDAPLSLPSGVGVFTSSSTNIVDPLLDEMSKQQREQKRLSLLSSYYEEIAAYAKTYQEIQSIFHKQLFYLISSNITTSQNAKKVVTPNIMVDDLFSKGQCVQIWDSQQTTYPVCGLILANCTDTKQYFPSSKSGSDKVETAPSASDKKLSATDKLSVGKSTGGATSQLAAMRASLMQTNQKTAAKPVATAPTTTTATATANPANGAAFTNETMTSLFEESFVYVMAIFPTAELLPQWCKQLTPSTEAESFKTIHDFLQFFSASKPTPSKALFTSDAWKELVYFGWQAELHYYYLIFPTALSSLYALFTPPSTLSGSTLTNLSVVTALDALVQGIIFDADESNNNSKEIDWIDYSRRYTINDVAFMDRYTMLTKYSKTLRQQYIYQHLFPVCTTNSGASLLPPLAVIFPHVAMQSSIVQKIGCIEHFISDESMSLFPDLTQRVRVLSALAYLDPTMSVITKKGRVACELNTCDELLGCEMLFHNILEPLNPPEAVGILSALVFQERGSGDSKDKDEIPQGEVLTSRMEVAKEGLMTIYYHLKSLQECHNLTLDLDLKPILNFGLCSVVYQWARGVPFKDIVAMTEFQEGSIVRCITRLDELCRDIQTAARVMGNMSLYYKMEAASQCIKRDIVFAASLYIV